MTAPGWMTVEEAADYVGMSPRSLSDLARARAVPHRRLPRTRRLRFRQGELDMWLDGCPLVSEDLDGGGRVVRPIEVPSVNRG
jgi:excisionase family DNA binding protein